MNPLVIAAAAVTLIDPVSAPGFSKIVLALLLLATLFGIRRARMALACAILGHGLGPLMDLPAPALAWPLAALGAWLSDRFDSNASSPSPSALVGGIVLGAGGLLAGPFMPLNLAATALAALSLSIGLRKSLILSTAMVCSLVPLVLILRGQFRVPNILFYAYERSEPALLDFFSRKLEALEYEDYPEVEYFQAGTDHYFLTDGKGWLSDGGRRIITPAAVMAVFASEWLRVVEPGSTLSLLTLSTPELCHILQRTAPEVQVFQASPYLNKIDCARLVDPNGNALADARHLMAFPAHDAYFSRHPPADFSRPGRSAWHCESADVSKDDLQRYPPLEAGFEGKPGPYLVQISTGFCLVTAGPGFFARPEVLRNPVVHRILYFSSNHRREVTPP